MPNQPKTPARAIRVDDDLWARLEVVAEAAGVTRSDVVRDAIEREVRRLEAKGSRSRR